MREQLLVRNIELNGSSVHQRLNTDHYIKIVCHLPSPLHCAARYKAPIDFATPNRSLRILAYLLGHARLLLVQLGQFQMHSGDGHGFSQYS